MKILVTGTAGFIGYHLALKLLQRGDEVVGIDNINDYYDVNLKYARLVSEYLKTEHNEYTFTLKEGVDSLEKVIWHIETYDTTSVRASTPMYLLTNKIKESYPNLKVLFSGEGADELFLSYRYGQYAPS